MNPNVRVLTVTSYGSVPEEDREVTLSAILIKMVTAKNGSIQGKALKETTIFFVDSDPVELLLSNFDLLQIQSVVGAYGFIE